MKNAHPVSSMKDYKYHNLVNYCIITCKLLPIAYDSVDSKLFWIDDIVIRSSAFYGHGETDVINTGKLV